jgi:hypothetical protein
MGCMACLYFFGLAIFVCRYELNLAIWQDDPIALKLPLRRARSARTHTACGVLTAPARNSIYLECYRACRRHQDCHCRKRRFRYVAALFGQLSGKPLLACIWSHGVRGAKRNGRSKIKCWAPSWRNAVVQLVNWLGGRRRKRFEFNRAALIRLEGERISQLLISLIGAIEHENRSEA